MYPVYVNGYVTWFFERVSVGGGYFWTEVVLVLKLKSMNVDAALANLAVYFLINS